MSQTKQILEKLMAYPTLNRERSLAILQWSITQGEQPDEHANEHTLKSESNTATGFCRACWRNRNSALSLCAA